MTTIRLLLAALAAFLVCSVANAQPRPGGTGGTGVTDGDKGDVIVSSSGSVFTVETIGGSTPVVTSDIDEASELDALNIVTKNSLQTISGFKEFDLAPSVTLQNLASGTALTANTWYYSALTADRGPLTFTLANGESTSVVWESDGSHTLSFPQAYRSGDSTQPTSVSIPAGRYYTHFRRNEDGDLILTDNLPASTSSGGALFGTTVSINNSVAETSVLTGTIPANTLGTYGAVCFAISGQITNNSGSTQGFTVRIKYGATTMYADATAATLLSNSATARAFVIRGTLMANAATNAQVVEATMAIGPNAAATTGYGDIGSASMVVSGIPFGGTASEDSTAAKTFAVTIELTAANASYTFNVERAAAWAN